jgi:hypothetical protein
MGVKVRIGSTSVVVVFVLPNDISKKLKMSIRSRTARPAAEKMESGTAIRKMTIMTYKTKESILARLYD